MQHCHRKGRWYYRTQTLGGAGPRGGEEGVLERQNEGIVTRFVATELDRRETAPCGSVGPIAGSTRPLPGATRRAPLLFPALCSPPGARPSARHLLVRPIVVRRRRASQASFQPCRSPPGQDPAFLAAHLPPFGLPSPPVGWAHRLSIGCELMLAHSGPPGRGQGR